jgi:hypothetical protein
LDVNGTNQTFNVVDCPDVAPPVVIPPPVEPPINDTGNVTDTNSTG